MKNIKINKTTAWENKRDNDFYSVDDRGNRPHALNIEYLMENPKAALRLHIDNLVLTYGMDALRSAVDSTELETIKKSKKAG